ncbi:hypothetical protein [Nonomuraea sediminis]|uniref:hypothetical protein n=1 Tax=Nonomuraea sediminis TaxID=2835864 RepID=UPI001BDD7B95|nr:hypothetical protein [Nonomuraea sediminis]
MDDVLPLQPPVRLPPESELAEKVPEGSLDAWAEESRRLLDPDGPAFMGLVRLFLAREPLVLDDADLLEELGLAVRLGRPYELTPLGLWTARLLISELSGQDIPVLGTLAKVDAAGLLRGLRSYPERERDEELAGWLAGRDEQAAAAELARVIPEASPLSRAVGVELLSASFGEYGEQELAELIYEPRVGAVVAARLGREDRRPAPEEIAWVLVDMAAALLEFGGEISQVTESVTGDQSGTISLLALCDHPNTAAVLRVFIEHHPDPGVAAAARKALRRLHGLSR